MKKENLKQKSEKLKLINRFLFGKDRNKPVFKELMKIEFFLIVDFLILGLIWFILGVITKQFSDVLIDEIFKLFQEALIKFINLIYWFFIIIMGIGGLGAVIKMQEDEEKGD